ncbi:polysaccharide deacetylase family protein [Streptomyces sp. GQFP]|uniref:polysaccharide deacetylase family protein n=1 Tax=Streptomyces sp. GQFP TaxID=2907545 RepID=UPI001F205482|nr:polysaccharide deacetylase family protein [Streptomyces sp. GQFP]UIX29797.1 polysaccharide deacetylase family protein [Streptomyces sp. GQFP]
MYDVLFHKPARVAPRRPLTALLTATGLALGALFASGPPAKAAPEAATVVSLTFDDGSADHYTNARPILDQHGMKGTFYVNSGRLGLAGYLTAAQTRQLAADGHEIGGHTVSHARLPTLSADDQRREICNDRVALLDLGLTVKNFAYPFGASTSATEGYVADCGYNSARDVGRLVTGSSCGGCPYANTVPPAEPYNVRTHDSVTTGTTLATLQEYVTRAEGNGGGWVPIVLHHVCSGSGCDATYATTPAILDAFLDWLQSRGTAVATVDEVIGGPLRPGVPGPAPGATLQNASLETASGGVPTCYQLGGYGTNTYSWSYTADAHSGARAERVDITAYTSGDRKLVTRQDAGACSPAVSTGRAYRPGLWFKGSWAVGSPVKITVHLRNTSGAWKYWSSSTALAASSGWRQATYTTPVVPSGYTAISFGLSLPAVGHVTVDDFSLAQV